MLSDPETVTPSAPEPEAQLITGTAGPVRRFFRDIESAGNVEDGMEFHAAGVVIDSPTETGITVLYLNPFTAKVEKRERELSEVILYEFPEDDGVYWRLWAQTRAVLESLAADQ
ncbi:MAG: hypothetical protein EOP87_13805 [Verrucomicrobiaceae bacterium]|nr:MAG: hypothetical protein EOP87_13805 [Verrucomicrobiaceae bacterium]